VSRKLVNHNADLKQLADEGYSIRCPSGYLVVSHIPCLTSRREVSFGSLVAPMTLIDDCTIGPPQDHQIYWCGEQPCHLDGSPILGLGGGVNQTALCEGMLSNFQWSNKPPEGFTNFYDKIVSYATIVAGPAMAVDQGVRPNDFIEVKSGDTESAFHFVDTMSSRADLFELNRPFEDHVISVIGLGGTGSYILDFISKMPLAEIRIFDDDKFHVHNAFRRPGSAGSEDFGRLKVELLAESYGTFHKNIRQFSKRITATDFDEVVGSSFVFVCVDRGASRLAITRTLMDLKIPFVDVGMGLSRTKRGLSGLVRTTLVTGGEWNDLVDRGLLPIHDAEDDVYSTNIQIGELNAKNACDAVIKYKRLFGFYDNEDAGSFSLFDVSSDTNSSLIDDEI
jgi:ThiF family